MLAAVDLHDQIVFTASEICEIGANRQLANKFVAVQSPSSQFMPQPLLGIVFNLPKLTALATFGSFLPRMALPLIRPSGTFSP